jgi:hypothetical protein
MEKGFIILIILFVMFLLYYWKVKEPFTNNDNVKLSFNRNISCLNKCSLGNNSCYITGEQCIKDSDCYGCKTVNQTPVKDNNIMQNYSTLTTDIGTKAGIYNYSQINKPPPQYNKGINTWRTLFDEGKLLYDKKYNIINGMEPSYEEIPTLSGEFSVIGPKPSNY